MDKNIFRARRYTFEGECTTKEIPGVFLGLIDKNSRGVVYIRAGDQYSPPNVGGTLDEEEV